MCGATRTHGSEGRRSQQCDLLTRHIAMRLTGLGQYAKGLAHHNPIEALALQHRLERIQWRLWHGDADEALTRRRALAADVAALNSGYPGLKRLVKATAGLATYIANNAAAIVGLQRTLAQWRADLDRLRWNPPSTSSSAGASPRVRPEVANRVTPGVCDRKA